MRNERGFLLLLTFIFMVSLIIMVGGLLFIITNETRDIGAQIDDYKLLGLSDAGIQRALREIRNDFTLTTQTGVADLRGNTTSGTAGASSSERDRVRYYNEVTGILTMTAVGAGTYVVLGNFDLNYLRTAIKNVKIGCRYSKASGGGINPRLEILYTTNGSFPEAGNSSFDTVVTSTSYNASPFIVLDISYDRSWDFSIINNSNFQIRARAYNSSNRNVRIDYLFLQVTYEIDTNTEAWFTGGYTTFPISLGGLGTIDSISIVAEQGKVHINTASQSLLRYLMQECGIASGPANTLANNIIAYRTSKPFDSVEELQQVTGMTTAYCNLIKNFVTVYSFINTSAQRPKGNRAPININTAARQVLEAVFDALSLGSTDAARLARDIIDTRATTPFTCFYSSNSAVTTDFYDFVRSRSYLSTSGNPDEQDRVLDNADASPLIPVAASAAYDAVTTEFSYDTNTFKVESVSGIHGRHFRVATILGDDGSHTFTTFIGDTSSIGYRRENFE